MAKIVAKVVDEVPRDIDGNCKFIIKCCSENIGFRKLEMDDGSIYAILAGNFQMSYVKLVIAKGHTYVSLKNVPNVHMKIQ